MEKKRSIFYGWYVVFAGMLIAGVGIGFYNNTASVFVKPVCEALGFSRGQFTTCNTITLLINTLLMPVFGNLFRRYGIRKFMVVGAVGCSLVPIAYSMATQLWQFYAVAVVFGILFNFVGVLAVGTLINNWFHEKKGVATGIAFAGSGLFAAVMIPVIGSVISSFSWQWGYRVLGIAGFALMLPALLIIRDQPAQKGLAPYGEAPHLDGAPLPEEKPGLTRSQALKTPTMWLLMIGFFAMGFCAQGFQSHTVSFLTDIGYAAGVTSAVASLMMLLVTVTKIGLGGVFDRFGALVACVVVAVSAITFTGMNFIALIPVIPWVQAAFMAVGGAGSTVLPSPLASRFFGARDFASIYSVCTMAGMLGSASGPPVIGYIYDFFGSYTPAWALTTGVAVMMLVCLVSANLSAKKIKLT